ncbi:PmoA family protein [Allonocardiopsis opalescens]|uniref:Methane monooxygenase PmoA-like n=1 Tax=Allonocardiopsis opalescens TaxID=1144618 RepID=A0A2T0QAH4_9ACTN|nr:PmoA family protein [Allonocardiopsis opalescens]PRY00847.1 methane monooxygenase PmoA-like [Allonocardiopsis opalescens]
MPAEPGPAPLPLSVGGRTVASYQYDAPHLEPVLGPRPFLHPVTTLGGTAVTDCAPEDHRWHLGVSVSLQDVAGTNFWGGRTYVRGRGYQALDDHGAIRHDAWGERGDDHLGQTLRWESREGGRVLTEERSLRLTPAPQGWRLEFAFELRNATERPVPLGSPGTNGRERAGYGGLFWRLPRPAAPLRVRTPDAEGEDAVHGEPAPWLAVHGDGGGGDDRYTLVLRGADAASAADPWFVRVAGYPGVGSALAFEHEVVLPPGGSVRRAFEVLVADGHIDPV